MITVKQGDRILYKNLSNEIVIHSEQNGVQYIQFKKLLEYEERLSHCFTTRIAGDGKELNLRINESGSHKEIIENYKKVCSVIGIDHEDLVFANQTHEDIIRNIDYINRGEGIIKPKNENSCDGMITDCSDVALITVHADCVGVIFYDPTKNITAVSHAGWRGTVKRIAAKTVKAMSESYGCKTENIIACITPSIGPCCFEVEQPVVEEFKKAFGFWEELIESLENGKTKINLWKANAIELTEAGLKEENVQVSGLCTACNNDVFYSYRTDKGRTGRMGAIVRLRK